jgi:hypothetical protein
VSDDELRARLRAAAAEHTPDRTVMLNRIAQNRATGRRPRGQALRLAGSALAVTAVLGIGGVARWALADEDHPDAPAPVATAAAPPTAGTPTSKAPTSKAPTSKAPPKTTTEQGPLWSDGSIDPASTGTLGLSDIILKLRAPITALDVTVRVALTPGLADQGAVHDVRTAQIDSTVLHQPGALVYHFKLHPGDTLAPGTYVFTAKYAHREGGRDAGADSYRAQATSGGAELDVHGDFY